MSTAARLLAVASLLFGAIQGVTNLLGHTDDTNRATLLLIQGIVFLIYAEVHEMSRDREPAP